MSEPPETPAARARRRWITLGEIIAILALAISAASWWDARQERATKVVPKATVAPLVLTGTVADEGARIDLRAAGDAVIQTQMLFFPGTVRAEPVETTGNARIEAGWFDTGLRTALKAANAMPGEGERRRIAVGIETRYVVDGQPATDRAIYDIGYRIRTRFLRPDAVEIEGVSLVDRVGPDLRRRVDGRFARQAK